MQTLCRLDKHVPFHRPSIGAEEINEVADTLRSGWLVLVPVAAMVL